MFGTWKKVHSIGLEIEEKVEVRRNEFISSSDRPMEIDRFETNIRRFDFLRCEQRQIVSTRKGNHVRFVSNKKQRKTTVEAKVEIRKYFQLQTDDEIESTLKQLQIARRTLQSAKTILSLSFIETIDKFDSSLNKTSLNRFRSSLNDFVCPIGRTKSRSAVLSTAQKYQRFD